MQKQKRDEENLDTMEIYKQNLPRSGFILFGVGLLTPPKAPSTGLRCNLWRGQETGHIAITAHEFMRQGARAYAALHTHTPITIATVVVPEPPMLSVAIF